LTSLDGLVAEVTNSAICVQLVKFLLCLYGIDGVNDELPSGTILDPIAVDIVCDVAEQLGEESDLDKLVKGNKL
jgi:hypothetical protein